MDGKRSPWQNGMAGPSIGLQRESGMVPGITLWQLVFVKRAELIQSIGTTGKACTFQHTRPNRLPFASGSALPFSATIVFLYRSQQQS